MKKNYFKNGFSLIELIIVMSLMSLILLLSYNFLFSSNKIYGKTSDEFELQAEIRIAAETINRNIRYTTVAFAVLDDHFNGSGDNLTDNWNYFGVSQDGKQVIHYKWDDLQNKHTKEVITSSREDIYYEIYFHQDPAYENQRILKYDIIVNRKKDPASIDKQLITEINTELEAINAIQVVDRGLYSTKTAVALAYRTDPTPTAQSQKVAVAIVLDTSGSMKTNLSGEERGIWKHINTPFKVNNVIQKNGEPAKGSRGQWLDIEKWYYNDRGYLYGSDNEPKGYNRGYAEIDDTTSRIGILRNQAKILIGQLKTNKIEGEIRIIPFSTRASYKTNWENLQDKNDLLKEKVSELVADGGTNTGDGLRYAYNAFVESDKTKARRNYLIVLVDGVTTYYSSVSGSTAFYSGTESAPVVRGHGSKLDSRGEDYVTEIGSKLQNYPNNITTFIIGFSDKWDRENYYSDYKYIELDSVNTIANACGISSEHYFNVTNQAKPLKDDPSHVFWAKDEESLQNVFDSISRYIEADFWQVSGPDN